ncbi:site-specific integrase [Microvirga sp. 0TCS3.31]
MKLDTQADLARRYGYFLWALMQMDRLDPVAEAGAQITPEAVERFITIAESGWSSVTLANSVYKLRRMAEMLAPETDVVWLREIEVELRAEARPTRRRENVTSDELLQAGETLFQEAESGSHLKPRERARLARNGLMIALLAVHPIRHKNFSQLTLGTTFRHLDSRWWIVLEAEDTKAGRVDERQVPDYLNALVERYLSAYRPILLAQKDTVFCNLDETATEVSLKIWQRQERGALWVAVTGDPLAYSAVGAAITETTEEVLGIRLSPHAFRRAAKATAIFFGGEHPRLAQGVLHHSSTRVGDENYDSSSSQRAALELTMIVRDLAR